MLISFNPVVSVVMLVFNSEKYLDSAIQSVISQTYRNFELIIVYDKSKDRSLKIIKEYTHKDKRISIIKNKEKKGISFARNIGLKNARGKYIAILDSDDFWIDKNKLKKQIEFLEENPDYVLIGTNFNRVNPKNTFLTKTNKPLFDWVIRLTMLFSDNFGHSTAVYSKSIALKIKGYNQKIEYGEDYDFFLRLGLQGRIANLIDYTTNYRIHGKSKFSSLNSDFKKNVSLKIIEPYKNSYPFYYIAKFWLSFYFFLKLINLNID